jgi:AcrR family transcriptional regulator
MDEALMLKPKDSHSLEANARERLLETAVELFAEKGYAGTYVREIVEKAGVSKPVLYYYFQSKEGLFHAILEWAETVQRKILSEVLDASGTVLERFIYMYRRVYEGVRQYQNLYKMINGLIYGPPQGAPEYDYARYQHHMVDLVKRIYCEGLQAGEISHADAEEVALLVLSLIDYCLNIEKIQPELADPQRPERLLRLAFQGLAPSKKNI